MQNQPISEREFPLHLYFFVFSVFWVLVLIKHLSDGDANPVHLLNALLYVLIARFAWWHHNRKYILT